MQLHKNFTELLLNEKMQLLRDNDSNFFNYEKFTAEEFYKRVKISYLEDDEIEELDLFIKEKLRDYPNYFPDISLRATKNLERDKETYNKKLEQRFIDAIDRNNVSEAVDNLMLKKYTKKIDSEVLDSIKTKEVKNIKEKVLQLLAKEITINLIISKIIKELKEKFSEMIFDETIKMLAKFMSYEIYLRTKKPVQYCGHYLELVQFYYDNIRSLKKKDMYDNIKDMIGTKEPSQILSEVKKF